MRFVGRLLAAALAGMASAAMAGTGHAQPAKAYPFTEMGVTKQDILNLDGMEIERKADLSHNLPRIKADADIGNPVAIMLLTQAYLLGIGTPIDFAASFDYARKAAAIDPDFGYAVGLPLIVGLGVPKDAVAGLAYLTKTSGLPASDAAMAFLKLNGLGVPLDKEGAVALAKHAMDRGSIFAGDVYALAIFSSQPKTAFDIFMKNAAREDDFAIKNLADMYRFGVGLAKDDTQARQLYIRCADDHNSDCASSAGFLLMQGIGGPIDIPRGISYLKIATAFGNPQGINTLGVAYQYGTGVPKNLKLACDYFEMSAAKNFPHGIFDFSQCYTLGLGGRKRDDTKGVALLTQAAEANVGLAQNDLGVMYNDGKHVHRDYQKALYWFQRAQANGDPNAAGNIATTQGNIERRGNGPQAAALLGELVVGAGTIAQQHAINTARVSKGLAPVVLTVPNINAPDHGASAIEANQQVGTVRISVCGRAVEHYAAMALMKRSPKMTAN